MSGFAFSLFLFFLKLGAFANAGAFTNLNFFQMCGGFAFLMFFFLKVGGFANVGAFTILNVFYVGGFAFLFFS